MGNQKGREDWALCCCVLAGVKDWKREGRAVAKSPALVGRGDKHTELLFQPVNDRI